MPYYYVPGPGASEAATSGGIPAGYGYPLETDMAMYSSRPYVNYVNYRPYPEVPAVPLVDHNALMAAMIERLKTPPQPFAPSRSRGSNPSNSQNRQANPSANPPANPPANQNNQQTSPGVYNGRVNVGDNLRLADVSLGGVPPTLPPTAPTAPAQPVAAPESMNYSNRLLRDLYGTAPDLVGSPDPEVVQDPAVVAPAPDVSQRTSVSMPSSPVASQAEFMTQVETAPMAQGNVVDTQTLSDASGTVQDVIRAMMAPYYNLFQQGASFGRALGRELRNPTVTQAGVTPIPGVATPAFMIP